MFIGEIWGKFTTFISWNFEISKFQESELGKFIPNFPLKHVITSKNVIKMKTLENYVNDIRINIKIPFRL